jgi:hypothetical protein
MTTKARNITYWTTTGLVAFSIGGGGLAQVAHVQGTVDGFVRILHYPPYFVTILGFGRCWEPLPYWRRVFHGSRNGRMRASSLT